MIKELASQTGSIGLAIGVLVIFAIFFAGVLIWVFRKSAKEGYDRTARLPLAEEAGQDAVKDHEYDGIREYDNKLPRWWLGTFVVTVIFSLGYWFYYHTTRVGLNSLQDFEASRKEHEALNQSAGPTAGVSDESLIRLSKDPQALERGKAVFAQNCLACHGAQAQGMIGPNLTDEYWLHGGSPVKILQTIENGVVAKGMLAWKGILKPEQIQELTAYILSVRDSHPPGAKEPQGEKEEHEYDAD